MIEKRRYRKISVRIWGDEKFRRLSKPKPNAQSLWFYLLTGPHTSALPGVFVSGEASLAEALGWSVKDFRRCFSELVAAGMAKAEWSHRVVWLPKAVNHNAPESPNVVKSWRVALDEVPECHLKYEAASALKAFIEGLGEGFRKALGEGWPGARKPTPVNQEQEQIQEQEQEQSSAPAGDGFDDFWVVYPKHEAKKDAQKAWSKLKPSTETRDRIMADVDRRRRSFDWRKEHGKFVPYPASYLRSQRWEDIDTVDAPALEMDEDWYSECERLHDRKCNGQHGHALQMGIDSQRVAS
jgi:hypothetical protein